MKINSDYRDLLRNLNEENVRYLVVGGYAWMAYTEPRYTKDLDIWIEPVETNSHLLLKALARFGAPTTDVTVSRGRSDPPPAVAAAGVRTAP